MFEASKPFEERVLHASPNLHILYNHVNLARILLEKKNVIYNFLKTLIAMYLTKVIIKTENSVQIVEINKNKLRYINLINVL